MVFSKVELNHTYHREQWLSSGRGIASRNRMHSEGQRHIMFHGHLYRTWRGELDNFLMSYMTMGPWHWSEITPPSYFLPLSSLQTSSKLSLPTLASLPFHTLLAPFSLRKFLFHVHLFPKHPSHLFGPQQPPCFPAGLLIIKSTPLLNAGKFPKVLITTFWEITLFILWLTETPNS